MAGRKKTESAQLVETVDLISLLTIPGQEGIYEAEIALAEPGEIIEEPLFEEIAPTSAISVSSPATSSNKQKTSARKEKSTAESLDSLSELMNRKTARISEPAKRDPTPPPLTGDFSSDSLESIAAEILNCEKCELCKTRNKTVPGVGNVKARLVLIGEAPGADEDASGTPFVGRAGQHLDRILKAAGFDRNEVFICNILKCRPPGNRNPTLEEMLCCTPFLQRQLRLIKPELIACLGNVAIKYVIGSDTPGITRIHGEWFKSIFGIETMAMYHPSYLIRSDSREKGSPNWQMWQDIQKLKKRYDELG